MNVNIKNLNLSVIMPAITKSGQLVCNDRVPSKEDKVEHASGLYLIYKDGHAEPFTGDNPKDCVRYIGLKHKRHVSFAISLAEHDSVQLLDDDSLEVSVNETYYERECDALFDFDGQEKYGTPWQPEIKVEKSAGRWRIHPPLGQLNLMAHYKDDSINDALEYYRCRTVSLPRRGIGPVPRAARSTHGTCTSQWQHVLQLQVQQ